MAPVFQRADRRYIANAVNAVTHGDQDMYESGLDFTSEGTRSQRAAQLVKHIFEETEDPDRAVVDLLNFLYVDSAKAEYRKGTDEFEALNRMVLAPRGVVLTDDGFTVGAERERESVPVTKAREVAKPVASFNGESNPLNDLYRAQPPSRNTKSVFVVHGRDTRPVEVVEQFLVYVGLRMMSWSEAREHTGVPQPTTYDIVRAGMTSAAAIVVIFSPDDEARLRPEFWEDGREERPSGQPRQNVLLEAGMAFASAPERTIFVQSATTRPISDISGFNWVKLDGTWGSREDFVKRLQTAGARCDPPSNLAGGLAGPFKVV